MGSLAAADETRALRPAGELDQVAQLCDLAVCALAPILLERREPRLLNAALLAFLCILGTQIVFWVFTQPANRATRNWTVLPENWVQLRNQWEYSHAASAVLNLIALFALLYAAVSQEARLFH